jgi:hypothetical protein
MELTKGDVLIVVGTGEYEHTKIDTICILNGILDKYNYSHYALRRGDNRLQHDRDWYNFTFHNANAVMRLEEATREHTEFINKLDIAAAQLPDIFIPFSDDIKRQAYGGWINEFLMRHIKAYIQRYEVSED